MTTPLLIQTGLHRDLPMREYHQIAAASNSRLSKLRHSPAHLKASLEAPDEETLALLVGRAAHTAILEPDYFDLTFVVAQQCDATKKGDHQRCSNMGILFRADLGWLCGVHGKGLSNDETRLVLPGNEHATCLGMRNAVYAHRSARQLLTGPGDIELTAVWHHEVAGVLCKARYDRYTPEFAGGAIVDVKSCRDASKREFERSIFTLGYHRQGALYLDSARALGIPAEHFVIVAVEKEPPYAVAVYRLTEGALDVGREQLRILLETYAACLEENVWPAYSDEVQDIAIPDWGWKQVDQELLEVGS